MPKWIQAPQGARDPQAGLEPERDLELSEGLGPFKNLGFVTHGHNLDSRMYLNATRGLGT